eukprot:m.102901 g.102901  ORF g.102901 m.102901 type:complete len:266 (-) comp12603_c0_seq3:629-1426(-)
MEEETGISCGEKRGETPQKQNATMCSMCGIESAVYRCPCCDRRTCSVACVKKHKVTYNCSGVRPRTVKTSSRKELTGEKLWQDYCLLEGAGRLVGNGKRTSKSNALGKEVQTPKKRRKEMRMCKEAKQSFGINLRAFPPSFKKHKENTSYFDTRRKRMVWRVSVCFAEAGVSFALNGVNGNTVLQELLDDKFFRKHAKNSERRHRVDIYVQHQGDILVLMKAIGERADQPRSFGLDDSSFCLCVPSDYFLSISEIKPIFFDFHHC